MSSADWKNGRGFMEVMRPFEQATKIIYDTDTSVIPVLDISHNKTTGEFIDQGDVGK
jgi:hypothetical protein